MDELYSSRNLYCKMYPNGYNKSWAKWLNFMNTLLRSDRFNTWLVNLRDGKAKARIIVRIERAEKGNFGDCQPVGEGVSEMRIDVGAGYRVYFVRRGLVVYFLLCGGDKSSQQRDIEQAKQMAQQLEDTNHD